MKRVPTTTATPQAFYSVNHSSDGKIQFGETWAVPSSTQPLRVRDVRVANSAAGADTSSGAKSRGGRETGQHARTQIDRTQCGRDLFQSSAGTRAKSSE